MYVYLLWNKNKDKSPLIVCRADSERPIQSLGASVRGQWRRAEATVCRRNMSNNLLRTPTFGKFYSSSRFCRAGILFSISNFWASLSEQRRIYREGRGLSIQIETFPIPQNNRLDYWPEEEECYRNTNWFFLPDEGGGDTATKSIGFCWRCRPERLLIQLEIL